MSQQNNRLVIESVNMCADNALENNRLTWYSKFSWNSSETIAFIMKYQSIRSKLIIKVCLIAI